MKYTLAIAALLALVSAEQLESGVIEMKKQAPHYAQQKQAPAEEDEDETEQDNTDNDEE